MATLYVRTVSDKLYSKLKGRAKQNHRSVAQEVVAILEDTLAKKSGRTDLWEEIEALRQRIERKYGRFEDSSPLIREDRQR